MSRIENHRYSIEEAFTECFYYVPDYQREYIWTEKEVTQLLEDINEQVDSSSSEYFIGTILVSQRKQRKHFDVIDGQQRLTTAFLILCALRVFFKGREQGRLIDTLITKSYSTEKGNVKSDLKLQPRYEGGAEIITKIIGAKDSPKAVNELIQNSKTNTYGSKEKLLTAYDVIYRFIRDNYNDESTLKKYWGHLSNKIVFIQISTDVSSALKIFETINERGVGLNPMDLLKNLLFTQVSKNQFSRLTTEWKKITTPLEENKEKPLRFLRYYLMANYKIKTVKGKSIIREDGIYDWITKKENASIIGYQNDPFDFVKHIATNVKCYIDFCNDCGSDGKPNLAMKTLRDLTGDGFKLHYVLLLAAADLPNSVFDQFVEQLECFLFYFVFTRSAAKDLERDIATWADEVRTIANIKSAAKQRSELNAFANKRFSKFIKSKKQVLEDEFMRVSQGEMPNYRIKYLLTKLTQYVEMEFKGVKKRGSLDEFKKYEIEHILPKKPKPKLKSGWIKANPDADYDEYKFRLGNLTLLEKPLNGVASNKFYTKKINVYTDCGNYLTRSLVELKSVGKNTSINRINKKLQSFTNWNAENIESRQRLLFNLALEVWAIKNIT